MSWFAYSSPAPVARRTNDENVHNDSTPNSHRQGGKKQSSVSLGATGSVTPRGARIGSSNHNHHHSSTTVSAPSPTSYMPPTTGGAAVGRKPVGHKYDRRSPAMDIPTTADDEAPSPNPAHLLDNASPEKKKKRADGSLVAAGQAAPTHRYDPNADHVGNIFAGKRTGFTPDPVHNTRVEVHHDTIAPASRRAYHAPPVKDHLSPRPQSPDVDPRLHVGRAPYHEDDHTGAGQAAPTHRYDPNADHVGNIFAGKRTGFTPDPVHNVVRGENDEDGCTPAGVRARNATVVASRKAHTERRPNDSVSGLMNMGHTPREWGADQTQTTEDDSRSHHAFSRNKATGRAASRPPVDEPVVNRGPSAPRAGQAAPTHRYDPDADHVGNIFAGKRTGFTPDPVHNTHLYPDDHVGNLMNGSKELLYHKYDQKDDDHIRGVDRYPVPNHYDHGHENHASYYASHNAEVDHLQQATPAGVRGRDAVATANRRAYHSPPVKDHLTPRPHSPMPEYVDRNPVGAACTKKRVGRAPVINHGAPVASRRSPANTFSNVFGYSVDQNAEQFGRLRQSQRFSASPAPGTTTSHQPAPKSSSVVAECLDSLSSPRPQSRPPTSRDGGGGIPFGAESTTSDYGRHHRVLGGATTTTTSSTARTTNAGAVVPPVMGLTKAATAARDPQPAATGMTPRQRMLKQFHSSSLW